MLLEMMSFWQCSLDYNDLQQLYTWSYLGWLHSLEIHEHDNHLLCDDNPLNCILTVVGENGDDCLKYKLVQ